MTIAASNALTDVASAVVDDLDAYVAERSERETGFRDSVDDLADLNHVIDALIAMRKREGISQKRLAKSMGVSQPTVSQFENESSDPRLSTLQRYARALGVRLHLGLEESDSASWTPRCVQFKVADAQWSAPIYVSFSGNRAAYDDVLSATAWDKQVAAENSRRDFALSA